MEIIRVWRDTPMRNICYLLGCPVTGEALAVDPIHAQQVLAEASARRWRITGIFNTHHHGDHIGGNHTVQAFSRAPIFAHPAAPIPHVQRPVQGGAFISVGQHRLEVLDTPGHTGTHLGLLSPPDTSGARHYLSGDTLFTAGCGNCRHGGDPELLYLTFSQVIAPLPDQTVLHPGHDYASNNLGFAMSREPGNPLVREAFHAARRSERLSSPTTLGQERGHNPFLRLGSEAIREGLGLAPSADDLDAFVALRRLRDQW